MSRSASDEDFEPTEGAVVYAVHKPTGERGQFRALKVDGKTLKMYRNANRRICKPEELQIIRVMRRGLGK